MKTIKIKGVIVSDSDKEIYDYFGIESTSPKSVQRELESVNGLDVEVEINSGGGDLYAGSEIYTILKSYKADVVVKITGIAASSASIIAMAGKRILMSPTAQFMIHNVWSYASGDTKELEKQSKILAGHDESVANAYMLKTNKTKEELLALMDAETYFNAREAKEHGFVDEIMFDKENKIAASIKNSMLPIEVLNKARELLHEKKIEEVTPNTSNEVSNIDIAKKKLNLLKLLEVK